MTNKTVNIYDVAKRARVSISCVSKYINRKPYVGKETAKKIEEAIIKLNYKPSAIARSLTFKKTRNIGVLIRDISNPFYSGIVKGIEDYIRNSDLNYNLLSVDLDNNDVDADKKIENFVENRVSGIITTTDKISLKMVKYLEEINLPIVLVSRYINNSNYKLDFIIVDNFKGAYMITDYLIKCRHKDFGFISGNLDTQTLVDRKEGFRKALKDSGMDIDPGKEIILHDYNIREGFKSAEILFSLKKIPTVVFCINDFMAVGFMDYCFKNNINIPEDISITGFDNIRFGSLDILGLTTVRQPIKLMGNKAAEILFKKMYSKDVEVSSITFEPELVIRRSVKCMV